MNEITSSQILSNSHLLNQFEGVENRGEQIEELATEFEGVFLSLLVKEMRATNWRRWIVRQ